MFIPLCDFAPVITGIVSYLDDFSIFTMYPYLIVAMTGRIGFDKLKIKNLKLVSFLIFLKL